MRAFMLGEAARRAGNRIKVFDWDKAATLIKARAAQNASAGLSGDWEYTGGPILEAGQPVPEDETYTYLASNWATPEIEIDGETIDCWRWADDAPGWDSKTYWPDSAQAILSAS